MTQMLEAGQTVDRYVVDSLLGRGGMAVVFRVRHTQLASFHALKVLTIASAGIKDRLLQEGRVQASLRHPNVVAVTDVLDVGGSPGLVMEYIEGPSLDRWLESNRPGLEQAEAIFRAIVSGVDAAHRQGLVHRDLKPANVLLAPTGQGHFVPKVADFGLAKALVDEDGGMKRTRSGVTMGTPQYMAPEQIRDAKNVDARADIFSLGCILYELVSGRPPFDGPDILSIFNAVASGTYTPPSIAVADLPKRFNDAIVGCLTTDRELRIPSCVALLDVLGGAASLNAVTPIALPPGAKPAVPSLGNETFVTSETSLIGEIAPAAVPPSLDGSIRPLSEPPVSLAPNRARVGWLAAFGLGGALFLGSGAVVVAAMVGAGIWWLLPSGENPLATWISASDGALDIGDVRVDGAGVHASDVVWRARDGQTFLEADVVDFSGPNIAAGQWATVAIGKLNVDLRRDGEGWVLPDGLSTLLHKVGPSADMLSVRDGTITVHDDASVLTLSGALSADGVLYDEARGFTADTVAVENAVVQGLDDVLRAKHVSLDSAGVLTLDQPNLWLRSRTDGLLDAPPVFAKSIPDFIGGQQADPDAPWYGIDLGFLPITPTRISANGGSIHLIDRAHPVKTVDWEIAIVQAGVGPLTAGKLPISLDGRVGDAAVSLTGDLEGSGRFRGSARVRDLPITSLSPYVQSSLDKHHLVVSGGTVDATVDLSLKGRAFAAILDGKLQNPAFTGQPERAEVPFTATLAGDLAASDFSPVTAGIQSLAAALFAPFGGAEPPPVVNRDRQISALPVVESAVPVVVDVPVAVETTPEPVVPEPEPAPAIAEPTPEPAPPPAAPPPKNVGEKVNSDVRELLDGLRLPRPGSRR